jgi:signal transduction histidine kinase
VIFALPRRSIKHKIMTLVLVATFVALFMAGIALLIYDARAYRAAWVTDLATQADILARASAPALVFHDPKSARENLSLLNVRPNILAGAIYTPDGELFASYVQPNISEQVVPLHPKNTGYNIVDGRLVLYQRIVENSAVVGTVFLLGQYALADRLIAYLKIIAAAMIGSLALTAAITARLQRTVTQPIEELTAATRHVIASRDFSQRVKRTTQDEIGTLVDSFNSMLAEVGRRAEQLEATNASLEREMIERRHAEEALRDADRRKDEFLATLAHELRNPLAPLRNCLEILTRYGTDGTRLPALREMMDRQLTQLVRLVDDLLDVSRITTGRLAVKIERLELVTILNNAIDTARPLMESKRHTFTSELPQQPVYLEGDLTRLSQVFANLLNNAARYTPEDGKLRLTAKVDRHEIAVSVIDNGIGLVPNDIKQIFGMFTQVDRSLERINAGLGVGLSLAQRLVELHHGRIEVRSAGLGQGSEFVVYLPIADSQDLSDTTDHSPRESARRQA